MPHQYDLHWTCHECHQPIADNTGVVIINNTIFHPNHQPAMMVLAGKRPSENVYPPDRITATLSELGQRDDDW